MAVSMEQRAEARRAMLAPIPKRVPTSEERELKQALDEQFKALQRTLRDASAIQLQLERMRVEYIKPSISVLLACATEARPVGGVYLLINDEHEVVYVGQSENVLRRMAAHDGKEFSMVRMIAIDGAMRTKLERKLILHFQPRYNSQHKRVGRDGEVL